MIILKRIDNQIMQYSVYNKCNIQTKRMENLPCQSTLLREVEGALLYPKDWIHAEQASRTL